MDFKGPIAAAELSRRVALLRRGVTIPDGRPRWCAWPRGKASNYVCHAQRVIRPGDKVVLCCRVSFRGQKDNLQDQEKHLRHKMERLGAIVVDVVHRIGSGADCKWLRDAARKARKHGAMLVAETVNRFVRSFFWDKYCRDAQATESDLKYLASCTSGVRLLTLLHPDASPAEEIAVHTSRGQYGKGDRGGRPPKPRKVAPGEKRQRREDMLPVVTELLDQGVSVRNIARHTGLPKSTVQEWKRYAEVRTGDNRDEEE